MLIRPLFLCFALSVAAAQTVPHAPTTSTAAPTIAQPSTALATNRPAIRFEDATNQAGIHFTHSFGSRQLGSLLEGTGAGCIWFDYNNDGLPDLYVVNGRPLDDSMHPYPLLEKPATPPHNHLYRNDGNGRFTDVTEKAGLNPDMYSVAVTAADYDNDGFEDLLVTDQVTGLVSQEMWIPGGAWYEKDTGTNLSGPAKVQRSFSIEQAPVYVRDGAIVPMAPPMQYTNQKPVDPDRKST